MAALSWMSTRGFLPWVHLRSSCCWSQNLTTPMVGLHVGELSASLQLLFPFSALSDPTRACTRSLGIIRARCWPLGPRWSLNFWILWASRHSISVPTIRISVWHYNWKINQHPVLHWHAVLDMLITAHRVQILNITATACFPKVVQLNKPWKTNLIWEVEGLILLCGNTKCSEAVITVQKD